MAARVSVPLDYSPTNEEHLPNLASLKRLAQAMAAEGRLAELENRPADAAEAYLQSSVWAMPSPGAG